MFIIEFAPSVADDLSELRAFDRTRILDEVEEQLTHEPTRETRNKKIVVGLVFPWEHEEPSRELRVDEFRIFYDVNEEAGRVTVRAVRHKPPRKTTEEIL